MVELRKPAENLTETEVDGLEQYSWGRTSLIMRGVKDTHSSFSLLRTRIRALGGCIIPHPKVLQLSTLQVCRSIHSISSAGLRPYGHSRDIVDEACFHTFLYSSYSLSCSFPSNIISNNSLHTRCGTNLKAQRGHVAGIYSIMYKLP